MTGQIFNGNTYREDNYEDDILTFADDGTLNRSVLLRNEGFMLEKALSGFSGRFSEEEPEPSNISSIVQMIAEREMRNLTCWNLSNKEQQALIVALTRATTRK